MWIGSAMLLGGEDSLCGKDEEVFGGGDLAAGCCWPAAPWKEGSSGLSKPCSSNNCKFARKTSMLARKKG